MMRLFTKSSIVQLIFIITAFFRNITNDATLYKKLNR